MRPAIIREARDQIHGIAGALLVVGLTFHYTMETWWLGWTLPLPYLVGYAFIGLTLIVVLARQIGFHKEEQNGKQSNARWYVVVDFAEILTQSFIASYTILLLTGIIDLTSSLNLVVRLGLIEIVPLGFGAALSNRVLGSSSGEGQTGKESQFPKNLALFTVGALFVASTIAPTQEMELIAAHMNWLRHFLLIALTVGLVYLILYELEFKGHQARIQQEKRFQIGTVFIVYTVGAAISFFLLTGFGHFINASVALMYQETVVLAFPASIGAAAAEVLV